MLEPFGPDIWICDGPEIVAAMGFHYPTRMTVIRLSDGGLFIWSPVQLTEALRAAVDKLGPVHHIIAPNSLHHVFMAEWKAAYPAARMYAPPNLREKRPDLPFDEELTDRPAPGWSGQIDQVVMTGNVITTELVFFHVASRTVLFTDLLQQLSPERYTGWRGLVAKLDLMTAPEPTVPRKFRLAFTNRKAARQALAQIYAWPAENILMAHGTPVLKNGKTVIERAFLWLDA